MTEQLTWTDLWADCTQRLGSSEEARRIIEHVSGRSGASWLITLATSAPADAREEIENLLERRLAGEPLQYVLGVWGFRRLHLHVDERVLIPRPETEEVVEASLATLDGVKEPVIVDLGTGSGAVALSLASEVDGAVVWATDVSLAALEVAELNCSRLPSHVAQRVQFGIGSWFDALPTNLKGRIDLIISNPPYVAENRPDQLEDQVKDWEPHSALFAGPEGLDAIEAICGQASEWLAPNGSLVVELAPEQAEFVQRRALATGFFAVSVGTDMAGRKRWVSATKQA